MNQKHDIENHADVERMVNSFYDKVRQNPELKYFFDDVAAVNWDEHLPKLQAFWRSVLFGEVAFKGNPMLTHIMLNRKAKLTAANFQTWLGLFEKNMDEHFAGPMASSAKSKAKSIAALMLHKIQLSEKPEP